MRYSWGSIYTHMRVLSNIVLFFLFGALSLSAEDTSQAPDTSDKKEQTKKNDLKS